MVSVMYMSGSKGLTCLSPQFLTNTEGTPCRDFAVTWYILALRAVALYSRSMDAMSRLFPNQIRITVHP